MATCEYRRVNRSISKSTTRSMAHSPGHCHRLHSADRLPVGPLLPGGIPATAPPARRPHRRGPGPPRDTPAAAADLPDPQGHLATGPRHPRGPTPPRRRPSPRQVWLTPTPRRLRVRDDHLPRWLAKAARVVKGMGPVRTGISAFRDRATEPLMPVVDTRRSARFGVSRGPLISSLCGRLRDELPACQFDTNGLSVSLHGGLRLVRA